MTARPWWWLGAALVVVGICAAPIANLQLGQLDASVDPTSHTQRRAYDLIAEKFTAGADDPLLVVAATGGRGRARPCGQAARGRSDVARVDVIGADARGHRAVGCTSSVGEITRDRGAHRPGAADGRIRQADARRWRERRVRRLHEEDRVAVADCCADDDRIVVPGPVVRFRGARCRGESALLNRLSIAASLGVVVAVFQFVVGWPIPSFMPLLMFALVFGLSMDYEIFILSRVREAYLRDDAADNRRSIIDGVAASAQVIAPAAMIMILVFAGFAMDSDGISASWVSGSRSPSLSTRP